MPFVRPLLSILLLTDAHSTFVYLRLQSGIEAKVSELRESVGKEDLEGMKKGMEALQAEVVKMGQAMYQQPGAPGAPQVGMGSCLWGFDCAVLTVPRITCIVFLWRECCPWHPFYRCFVRPVHEVALADT